MTTAEDGTAAAPPPAADATDRPGDGAAAGGDGGAGAGVAGRTSTDYASWDRRAASLLRDADADDEAEAAASGDALGHGRHPASRAEADELRKSREARKAGRVLEGYRRREGGAVQVLTGALGEGAARGGGGVPTRYVTRGAMGAGKRVLTVSETAGPGRIVLTQDLSHLECSVPASAALTPRSYPGDSENDAVADGSGGGGGEGEGGRTRSAHGLIKLNLHDLAECAVVVRCKIITGTVEVVNCRDVTLKIEADATVATVQADLCRGLRVEFHDAPSGKNPTSPLGGGGGSTTVFWGEDKDDRIYHAGVSDLRVVTYRDGYVDLETSADYVELGAEPVGNATAEEVQFVTSVVNGELVTERVARTGGGSGARAMTEREAEEEREKRETIRRKVGAYVKGGENGEGGSSPAPADGGKGEDAAQTTEPERRNDGEEDAAAEEVAEEVYASMTRQQIDAVVSDCDAQKAKGNEAFAAGEYAQAVLLYSLALDRAAELPDEDEVRSSLGEAAGSGGASAPGPGPAPVRQLFPRHVVLSNRSAAFLKLGEHERALADATAATVLDPAYVKGSFRRGMALHAMGRYGEAVPALAAACKIEPKNKQIRQALQFAEMRLQKEMQRRMEGS